MKKIGMLVAVEINAVLEKYGARLTEKTVGGFRVLEYKTENYEMTIVSSGAGEIAAAAGTQLLISEYKVDLILNFGVVGGLTDAMTKTRTCVVKSVVHYDFDMSPIENVAVGQYLQYDSPQMPTNRELFDLALRTAPQLVPVVCASGDKFVAEAERKRALHREFGADICEMEAAAIVMTCDRWGIPCLLIKAVSDGVTGGAEEFKTMIDEAAAVCLEIVDRIAEELR